MRKFIPLLILLILLTGCTEKEEEPLNKIEEAITFYDYNEQVEEKAREVFLADSDMQYYVKLSGRKNILVESFQNQLLITAQNKDMPTFSLWQDENGEWKYQYMLRYEYHFTYHNNDNVLRSGYMKLDNFFGDMYWGEATDNHNEVIYLEANQVTHPILIKNGIIYSQYQDDHFVFMEDLKNTVLKYYYEYDAKGLTERSELVDKMIEVFEQYGTKRVVTVTRYS